MVCYVLYFIDSGVGRKYQLKLSTRYVPAGIPLILLLVIVQRLIIAEPDNVITYRKVAIALHNYLRTEESCVYCPAGFIDSEDGDGNVVSGDWREEGSSGALAPIGPAGSNHHSRSAATIRKNFCNYFNSPAGEVSWQYKYLSI